jgi:hypothetical protein
MHLLSLISNVRDAYDYSYQRISQREPDETKCICKEFGQIASGREDTTK